MNGASKQRLTVGVLLALLCVLGFSAARAQGDVAGSVLAQINQARAAKGLAPLVLNGQLNAAAQAHADDLQQHNAARLGHRGSDGSTPEMRIARAGYSAGEASENWAGYRSLDMIMNFWLTDPPHRQNIYNRKFVDIGIGVAVRPSGGLIVVTDFGAPGIPRVAKPESAVQKAAPTKARAKPTAKRVPTKAPTRKPAAKPKQPAAPKPRVVAAKPTKKPAKVAQLAVPQPVQVALLEPRIAPRAGSMRSTYSADVQVGPAHSNGDPFRMALGGIMVVASALTLGGLVVARKPLKE